MNLHISNLILNEIINVLFTVPPSTLNYPKQHVLVGNKYIHTRNIIICIHWPLEPLLLHSEQKALQNIPTIFVYIVTIFSQDFSTTKMNEATFYCGYIYDRIVILIDKIRCILSLCPKINNEFLYLIKEP